MTNGFKETDVGLLPTQWEVSRMGDVCSITTGKRDVNEGSPEGAYPFFTCAVKVSRSDTYAFDTEAVLVAGNGEIGHAKYYKGKFEVYQRTYVLTDFKCDARCLYFYIHGNLKRELVRKKSGSTMPYIRMGDLTGFQLPLPPLPEQRKIAGVLGKVQRAVELQEAILANLRELKKSTMHRLFTHGLRGEKLKQTEIGKLPVSWEVKPLNTVTAATDLVSPAKEPDRIIKYVDVSGVSSESLSIVSSVEYRLEDAPGRARKLMQVNDVIFATVRPTLRRIVLVGTDYDAQVCSTAFCVLRVVPAVAEPRYVFYAVQRPEFLDVLGKIQTGANYPAVTDRQVKSQLIPLPELNEQMEIAGILRTLDEKLAVYESKKTALQDLFKTTLNQLMTGAVRVSDLDIDTSEVEVTG